jgi:hypothetical protein
VNEVPSHQLTVADLPDPEDRSRLAEFAHTFDGYRHFGEGYEERMNAMRERWETEGTLPDDLDDLRACLFPEHRRERFVELDDVFTAWDPDGSLVHEADPERVTPERAAQDRYRSAVVARVAALLDERR